MTFIKKLLVREECLNSNWTWTVHVSPPFPSEGVREVLVPETTSQSLRRTHSAPCKAAELPCRTDKRGRAECCQICCWPTASPGGQAGQSCGGLLPDFRAGRTGPSPRREAAGEHHTIGTLSVNRVTRHFSAWQVLSHVR